jgi:hypothetical protein
MPVSLSIIRRLTFIAILVSLACTGFASPPSDAELTAQGRHWTQEFYEGKTQDMWDHMSPPLQKLVGDKAGLDAFRDKVLANGSEKSVLEEKIEPVNGAASYIRVARFERAPVLVRIAIAVDGSGTIILFSVRPTSGTPAPAPLPSEGT